MQSPAVEFLTLLLTGASFVAGTLYSTLKPQIYALIAELQLAHVHELYTKLAAHVKETGYDEVQSVLAKLLACYGVGQLAWDLTIARTSNRYVVDAAKAVVHAAVPWGFSFLLHRVCGDMDMQAEFYLWTLVAIGPVVLSAATAFVVAWAYYIYHAGGAGVAAPMHTAASARLAAVAGGSIAVGLAVGACGFALRWTLLAVTMSGVSASLMCVGAATYAIEQAAWQPRVGDEANALRLLKVDMHTLITHAQAAVNRA